MGYSLITWLDDSYQSLSVGNKHYSCRIYQQRFGKPQQSLFQWIVLYSWKSNYIYPNSINYFLGADQFKFSGFFQRYGEKIIGPLLLLIGIFMLDIIRINFPGFGRLSEKMEKRKSWRFIDAVLLGIVFALAFCPYSGVLYFGMLVPLTVSSASGLYLPVIFAIATGIPVIIFAWVLAYTVSGLGGLYNKIKIFELWFRRVIAVVFIIVGLYYIIRIYL